MSRDDAKAGRHGKADSSSFKAASESVESGRYQSLLGEDYDNGSTDRFSCFQVELPSRRWLQMAAGEGGIYGGKA